LLKFVDGTFVGFTHLPQAFNKYIQPPEGVYWYWNTAACAASHNLTPNSSQIRSANDFAFVWHEFCAWIDDNVPSDVRASSLPIAVRHVTCGGFGNMSKQGLTNGISHKRKAKTVVVESKKKRCFIVGHTNFRVKLGKKKGSSYCRMCYRNQKGAVGTDGKKLTAEEKKEKCNWSYMGCIECGEQVCGVGKRGTISTSHCDVPAVVMHKVYHVMT
jgi:hypothetical protein